MGQIHLMVALEDSFGIHLEVEDFARLTSVPAILDHLARQGIR
jgi:acyl carrier protein